MQFSVFDWSPLWLSLKTATLATLITLILGVIAARLLLEAQTVWQKLLDALLTLPLVLPPTVIGFGLLLLFGRNGIFGKLLATVGIRVVFSETAAVMAASIVAFPLMYRTVLAAFRQVNPHYLQVARTLGASEWAIFWQILLPLAFPGVIAGIILTFARALGEFGATLLVAGNLPDKTQTIPTAIFFYAARGDLKQAGVWVFIICAIALPVIIALNYWSRPQLFSTVSPISHYLWELFTWLTTVSPSPFQSSFSPSLNLGVTKPFPEFTLNLNLNTTIFPLAVLGASGAGKTMMLRCLAGLDPPKQGTITLNGRTLFDSQQGINVSPQQRQISLLFQDYALFPHLTVAQNILFGVQHLSRQQQQSQLFYYLDEFQLHSLSQRYPHQLSGGQQQRVALARALIVQPQALLLDEPFSALDTHLRQQMEQQLRESLRDYRGVTVLVTHNLEEAYRQARSLLILDQGQVIAYGDKTQLFDSPSDLTVAQLTNCQNISPITWITSNQVYAEAWDCVLKCSVLPTTEATHVAIRAHHLYLRQDNTAINTFTCWLSHTLKSPHHLSVFLHLHTPPQSSQAYHLQVELNWEQWEEQKALPFPWWVKLPQPWLRFLH